MRSHGPELASVAPGLPLKFSGGRGRGMGGMALLAGETQGVGIDFSVPGGRGSVAVKDTTTPANNKDNVPVDDFLTNAGTSPKLVLGADGLYHWSPHNLAPRSETFDNADWFRQSCTVGVNAIAAPSGAVTADKIIPDAGFNNVFLALAPAGAVNVGAIGLTVTNSVYVRAGDFRYVFLADFYAGSGTGGVMFDLQTGTALLGYNGSNAADGSIADVGGGWFRLALNFVTPNPTTQLRIYLSEIPGGVSGVTGDGVKGFYAWGAQVNRGPVATAYHVTTASPWFGVPIGYDPATGRFDVVVEQQATNLLLYSKEFERAAYWPTIEATVSANQTAGPDGSMVADKVTDTTANNLHLIYTGAGGAAPAVSTAYTFSIFAKYINHRYVAMRFYDGVSGFAPVVFDLLGGVVTTQPAGSTGSIAAVGTAGWFRLTMTRTTDPAANGAQLVFYFADGPAYALAAYAGTGTDAVYISDAQFELGSVATSPIPTFAATVTRAGDALEAPTTTMPVSLSEGTFVVEMERRTENTADEGAGVELNNGALQHDMYQAVFDDGSFNSMRIRAFNSAGALTSPGALSVGPVSPNWIEGEGFRRAAWAWKSADSNIALNGAVGATDAGVVFTAPAALSTFRMSILSFGFQGSDGPYRRYRSVTYFPRRISNLQLQTKTSR